MPIINPEVENVINSKITEASAKAKLNEILDFIRKEKNDITFELSKADTENPTKINLVTSFLSQYQANILYQALLGEFKSSFSENAFADKKPFSGKLFFVHRSTTNSAVDNFRLVIKLHEFQKQFVLKSSDANNSTNPSIQNIA